MMDWNVFYRAIGIAEDIIDPSHYHVLGLPARDCDREKVEKALADRKRELRQSIPSPEFITLVLQFEKEVLEPAAAILADDEKRDDYNRELLTRQREIEIHNRKKQKLVDDVRAAIAESVDEKGCLGGVERYLLEEKLRLLEVQEHNIKQILGRIPEPLNTPFFDQQRLLMFFAGAVQLSIKDDVLGITEEQTLNQLAARLGLDAMQARLIIDQQLAQLTARRQGSKDYGGIVLERPIRFDEPEKSETPAPQKRKKRKKTSPPPEDIEEVVEQMHHLSAERVFQVLMPIAAITIFIATVYFLNAMVQKRRSMPDMSQILPAKQSGPKTQPSAEKNTVSPQSSVLTPPTVNPAVKSIPAIPQIMEFQSEMAEMPFLPSSTLTQDQLLADITQLMVRIRSKAADFRQVERIPSSDKLPGSADEIRLDEIQQELTQLRLDELKAILSSDREADRLYAVTRLASIHQMPAYEIMLESLEDRTSTASGRVVTTRILAELVRTNSNRIAHELAQIMERTGRQTAFQIQLTLMQMTQMVPAGAAVLPLKNTIQQRKTASQWWQTSLWNWDSSFSESGPPPVPQEFIAMIRQAATVAQYARQAAAILTASEWADEDEFAQRIKFKYGFDVSNLELLRHSPAVATALLADALDQRVRTAPASAVKADIVVLDRRSAVLAADDDLRAAAANMAAANSYLSILAAQADTQGQYHRLLEEFRETRQLPAVLEADSPLAALRNECRLNVLYWDLLFDIQRKEQK